MDLGSGKNMTKVSSLPRFSETDDRVIIGNNERT